MILGIGSDIIEISRIEKAIKNQHFLNKYFSQLEIDLCNPNPHRFAGNFAAKEAVSKALGTGLKGLNLIDIEILRLGSGAPFVVLHNTAKSYSDYLSVSHLHITISHCKDYAVAYCIAEQNL